MIFEPKVKRFVSLEELAPLVTRILNTKFGLNAEAARHLCRLVPQDIGGIYIDFYYLTVRLRAIDSIHRFYYFTKHNSACQLKVLTDLTAVDLPGFRYRFSIIYVLLSTYFSARCLAVVRIPEAQPACSIVGISGSAGWLEREVWDLFGVPFSGNHDLRRILTDYGFRGHPLRKDFPLSGYHEIFYSTTKQRVRFAPTSLAQEYRNFSFANPWG